MKREPPRQAAFAGTVSWGNLPKVDLHCHLDGSVPLAAWREMAKNCPDKLPQNEAELLARMQAPPRCSDLAAYLECFGYALDLLRDMTLLYLSTTSLIEELARENVVYAELRFAPMSLCGEGENGETVVQTVLRAMRQAEAHTGITVRAILCMMRGDSGKNNRQVLELARDWRREGVVAVDLAGDEARHPPESYSALFERAAAYGLPYTIHAGECGSADNVRRAAAMGARRIGHGIAAQNDPALMEELARSGVMLEMCPLSNLQTGAVCDWQDYPLEIFLRRGIRISVNTDNRTVSNTSLTREFETLARHFASVNTGFVRRVTSDALEGAFLDEKTKREIAEKIKDA